MNGQQIETMLRHVPSFLGVFASDTLHTARIPTTGRFSLVVNTDPLDKPGRHWIAIVSNDAGDVLYYFDSLGGRPRVRSIVQFCYRFSRVYYNRTRHQSVDEETCGAYCVYVINEMCGVGRMFSSILRTFKRIKEDDAYVREYIARHFSFHF